MKIEKLKVISHKKALTLLFVLASFAMNAQKDNHLIKQNGKPYSGSAQFKFAITSGDTSLWSNDGTSINGQEPNAYCTFPVKNGVFSAQVGSKPMKPFFYEILQFFPQATLKTWVNVGEGFKLLPLQEITAKDVVEVDGMLATQKNKRKSLLSLLKRKRQASQAHEIEQDNEGADEYEGMMRERFKKRASESGTIAMDALLKAKNKLTKMKPVPSDDAGLWTWEWLGPGNIGGRIKAIAIRPNNPSVIYIGAASGGLWKSINGGGSWEPINDFLANLCITSIIIDPTNPNIMYASTGEGVGGYDGIPGAGIFKSVDGGNQWIQLSSTNFPNFTWVNCLAHHPSQSGNLYAVTSPESTGASGTIYQSIDGGATWNALYATSSRKLHITISPHNPKRILVGTDQGLLKSEDGQTFSSIIVNNQYMASRYQAAFCPSDSLRMYASVNTNGGEVWHSADKGATWQLKNTGNNYLGTQGGFMNAIWVDPLNADRLIVGGLDLYRSVDGGVTHVKFSDWQTYHNGSAANSAHADHYVILHHPNYDANTNNTVYFINDGGIQKTANVWTATQSTGWTNLCGTSLGITQFYGGAAAYDGSIIIGGTQDNDNLRYRATGDWSGADNWYQHDYGDGGYCAVDHTNPDIFYVEYIYLKIKKTSTGGNSYFERTSGLTDVGNASTALFIAPFVMDPNNPDRLIAGGASIWRTTDAAASWQKIMDKPGTGYTNAANQWINHRCGAIDIAPSNSDVIWVGYENGDVYKTTNGFASNPVWTRVDTVVGNNLPNRWVTDIAINPQNPNEVFVTLSGYLANTIWFTSDGGQSWTLRNGAAPYNLPEIQVNTIRFHPVNQNWVYIGTDLGVFASMDKGQSWSTYMRYETNEGPCNVAVDELFWQGNEFLIAATHGRGMYRAQPLTIVYVDKNAAPGGDGSLARPYKTVTEAENNAGWGSSIYIKSNTYDEANGLMLYKKGSIKTTNGTTIIK